MLDWSIGSDEPLTLVVGPLDPNALAAPVAVAAVPVGGIAPPRTAGPPLPGAGGVTTAGAGGVTEVTLTGSAVGVIDVEDSVVSVSATVEVVVVVAVAVIVTGVTATVWVCVVDATGAWMLAAGPELTGALGGEATDGAGGAEIGADAAAEPPAELEADGDVDEGDVEVEVSAARRFSREL